MDDKDFLEPRLTGGGGGASLVSGEFDSLLGRGNGGEVFDCGIIPCDERRWGGGGGGVVMACDFLSGECFGTGGGVTC